MNQTALKTIVIVALLFTATPALAQKTIKLDFDSTDAYTESDDVKGTSKKSALTAAQKTKIIAQVQKQYDDAVGGGKVVVSEGKGGDVDVIINGGKAPGVNEGKEYGDAGKPGKPGVVHEGEFVGDGFSGDELANAIAESAAHEAGHKLGLDHNWDDPPTKMTTGSKVDTNTRKTKKRSFNAGDATKLGTALALNESEHRDSFAAFDLGVFVGDPVQSPPNKPDDTYLDVIALFAAPDGSQFGYVSATGEFVVQGQADTSGGVESFMTLIYFAGLDLGFRIDGSLFTLSSGLLTYDLFNPNPFNPNVFLTAVAALDAGSFGSASLTLNATIDQSTGGFFRVPAPPVLALFLTGIVLLARSRGWGQRAEGARRSSA